MVKYQGYILQGSNDRLEAIDDILRIFFEDSSILKVSLINLVEKTFDFIKYTLDQPLARFIGMSKVGQYNRSGSAVDPLRLNNAPIDLASIFQFPLSTPYW